MTHWAHINIFPDEFIALQAELIYHPILQELLANHPAAEWEIKLAEIACYCEMILDGDYMPEDILKICDILRTKLIARRMDNRGLLVITSAPDKAIPAETPTLVLPYGTQTH